jgi:xanthine dehydrogenase molybdenum-binding subunit
MIAAEYLDLDLDDVNILTGDTIHGAFDYYEARSSRTATISGHLILRAIDEAKGKICELAAPKLETEAERLEVKGKRIYLKDDESKFVPISEVITTPVYGSASGPPNSAFPEIAEGIKTRNLVVTAAEVEVDVETGQVEVIQLTPGTCPGRIINPGMVLGQYRGGAVYGLGLALYENVNFDQGNNAWVSRNFQDYKVPTAWEVPVIKPVVLESVTEGRPPNVGGAYGARGAGEWGVSQVVPAVANAIYNALGNRLKRCPMIPEVILETLKTGE